MNNQGLLTGLLAASLLSGTLCAAGQTPRVYPLDEIFATAEANSVQLKPSLAAEEVARREVTEARQQRLPEINAEMSLSYIADGFTTSRSMGDYQRAPIPHFGNGLGITIEQPVYAGGAIANSIELAELKTTAARFATDLSRDNLRMHLAGQYLDLYKYDNMRMVMERNIARARKVLSEMEARHSQGVALRNDITRYELLLSNLELQLVKINNLFDLLNHNLVVTAGLPEGTVVIPDSTILARSLPMQGEEWWQQQAADNAPAIALARQDVDINRKAESLVRSRRLPKIGLRAGWNFDGPILVEVPPINRNLSYWYVGLGVSYNLSSLYKNDKSLSRSKASTLQAVQQLDATAETVSLGIRAAHTGYLEAYEELKTCNKSVELADRNYTTVETRYSAGMALITDLLDAANSRLDAEQRLVNARINIIYSYYKLLFTSGTI